MDVRSLTPSKLREILRAGEGIATQNADSKAHEDERTKRLVLTEAAHSLSRHLHSANPLENIKNNTLFISMDDMVAALTLAVQSPEGVSTLTDLKPGVRAAIKPRIGRLFPFQCEILMPSAALGGGDQIFSGRADQGGLVDDDLRRRRRNPPAG